MEFIKKAIKLGNSAGVILPKRLLGADVKVVVIKRPIHLKKLVFELLEGNLADILSVFLIGKKPLEVLAVSHSLEKVIETPQIKIKIIPLSLIKREIKTKSPIRGKIINSSPIMNSHLLSELKREIKLSSPSRV
ncbi:DUF2080 family transposase-associated protein [Candidatus Pacearchaeota archaeon]|nr:DUF2080 family transposase-associated protein [Candidatus Pacearchaeota archaeon]